MKRSYFSALVGLTAFGAFLSAMQANAAVQGITGKKLLIKDAALKTILISKDPSITIAGSNPMGGADSSITFDDGGTFATYDLPNTNWSTNGSGSVLKYKNAAAEPGPTTGVKIVKLKAGLLKVVISDQQFPLFNGPKTFSVILNLDGGTNTYCMTFAGTVADSKFLAKNQPAGTCPPACGNNVKEGSEECDGSDATACPGSCNSDCTCAGPPGCGNNVREGSEECDGTDDGTCTGNCQANCTCGPPTCGGTFPSCNGTCGFGEECLYYGLGGCICAPIDPPACTGGSSYPTCGGGCPAGFVCQATLSVTACGPGVTYDPDCKCVASASSCHDPCPNGSVPHPGVCPSGTVCFFGGDFCSGDCGEQCCVAAGQPCTSGAECCSGACTGTCL